MGKVGKPRKLSAEEEQSVYDMVKKKVSIVEVAYKHNISTSTVHRIVRRIEKEK